MSIIDAIDILRYNVQDIEVQLWIVISMLTIHSVLKLVDVVDNWKRRRA